MVKPDWFIFGYKVREETPNDRKLSDTPERRGTCEVGGKAVVAAGAVTRRRVRCSAWLGVAVIGGRVGNNWNLAKPKLIKAAPCRGADGLQERKELLGGNIRVAPDVLDALQDANDSELSSVVVAFGVKALNKGADGWELVPLLCTVEGKKVPREYAGVSVKQILAVVGTGLGKVRAE